MRRKVRVAGVMLNGNARSWFDDAKAVIESWQQFQDSFKEHFCPQAFLSSKRVEFERFQQGDMTIAQCKAKFRELCEYVPYMVPNDEAKRTRFIEGLRTEYSKPMSAVPYPSYTACRSAALEMERMSQLRREQSGKHQKRIADTGYGSSSQGPSKKSSRNSGFFGGNINSNTFKNNRQNHRQCEVCGNFHSGECKALNRQRCFNCGQLGHFVRDCPTSVQGGSGDRNEDQNIYN